MITVSIRQAMVLVLLMCLYGLIAIGFQNCSQVGFSSGDGGASAQKGDTPPVDPGDLAGQEINDDNGDEIAKDLEDNEDGDDYYDGKMCKDDDDDDDDDDDADDDDDVVVAGLSAKAARNHKVLVCHYPSGNVANRHTICISINALKAHVGQHGAADDLDYVGSCEELEAKGK